GIHTGADAGGLFQPDIKRSSGSAELGDSYDLATLHARRRIVGHSQIRQIQRGARAGADRRDFATVTLKTADACDLTGGLEHDGLIAPQRAPAESAGDDGADTVQGEGPIDRKARFTGIGWRWGCGQRRGERAFEFFQAAPAEHGSRDDGSILEKRIPQL